MSSRFKENKELEILFNVELERSRALCENISQGYSNLFQEIQSYWESQGYPQANNSLDNCNNNVPQDEVPTSSSDEIIIDNRDNVVKVNAKVAISANRTRKELPNVPYFTARNCSIDSIGGASNPFPLPSSIFELFSNEIKDYATENGSQS